VATAAQRSDERTDAIFSAARITAASVVATLGLVGLPALSPVPLEPQAQALLTAGDPVKNARAILRNALPIDNKPIRKIQIELESINEALRIPGQKSLGPIQRAVRTAEQTLDRDEKAIVSAFAPDKKAAGLSAVQGLRGAFKQFDTVLEEKDKQEVPIAQQRCLLFVGDIEEAMVRGFPFEVPKEYSNLPVLLGRATVEMKYTLNESRTSAKPVTRTMIMEIDGYNAPVSAGTFLDLVEKKWYDGMQIQRADGFVVQTGKPEGKGQGYVDPNTGTERRIPLEIKAVKDKLPTYELSFEDLGRPNDQPSLPFNAFGTLAWARSEFENNSASSQIFWLLKESELTPSGANLLDGRYAVFGYIVDGQEDLLEMKVGDKIEYMKCIKGCDNLRLPKE
jgi:cyclophilin family peptidyl-prolyl cis-trans isomerase